MAKKGSVKISQGYVVLYFCFDVANEMELDKLETIFGQITTPEPLRVRRIAPKYIQYRLPPVFLKLGTRKIGKDSFSVEAKIYDFGTITLRYWLPLTAGLDELRKYGYQLVENEDIEKDASQLLETLRDEIKESLVEPGALNMESYAFYYVNKFSKQVTAAELLKKSWKDIAAGLACETQTQSEQELKDNIKNPLSYYPNDLVVVGWNAAFVYDPTHSYEVLDVIEYSVIELLELRTYDSILDNTLDKAYADITTHRRHYFFDPGLRNVLGTISATRLEVLDVIDKVENGLKLFGDLYLVKIYNAAESRFGLERWKQSVSNKLKTLMDTYSMLHTQLEGRRMILLEAMIVALFILDIGLILVLG